MNLTPEIEPPLLDGIIMDMLLCCEVNNVNLPPLYNTDLEGSSVAAINTVPRGIKGLVIT